jgi:hypothetical protein
LTDETIRAWGLGYHERKRWRDPGKWGLEGGNKIFLPRGVVIPWTVDGTIWHVKFRRFDDDPKYIQVRGGLPTLYGLDQLTGKQTVVICEGEFDAVLLQQEAGDLVDVVAIGAKAAKVNPKALAHLAGASDWLLALDTDAEDEAGTWAQYSGRVRRIKPLEGNDLTDFHNAGGDLRAWIEHHTAPLGDGLLAEAEALLQTGLEDPGARVRYAEIADRLGWPCSGMTWKEWGAQ